MYKKVTPQQGDVHILALSFRGLPAAPTDCWFSSSTMCVPGTELGVSVLAALPLPTVSPAPRAMNSCARLSFSPFHLSNLKNGAALLGLFGPTQYNQDHALQASPEPNCNPSNPSWVCLVVPLLEILDQVDSSNPFPIVNVPLYTIPTQARQKVPVFPHACQPGYFPLSVRSHVSRCKVVSCNSDAQRC